MKHLQPTEPTPSFSEIGVDGEPGERLRPSSIHSWLQGDQPREGM